MRTDPRESSRLSRGRYVNTVLRMRHDTACRHARTHAACMHPVQPKMRRIQMNGAYPFCANHSVRCLLLARISRVRLIVKGLRRNVIMTNSSVTRIYLFITEGRVSGASNFELSPVITDYLKVGAENTFINRVIGKCFLVIQAESFKTVSCPPDGCTYRFFEITQLVKRLSHGK